jgi:glycosyltransferase involved in cell wall biosynthesis
MLVKVFLETFKNMKKRPGLIMKTSGAGFSVMDREDIINKINDIKSTVTGDLPNIYFLHGDFTDEEMNQIYNHPKVKAHINLTHGEGFGRPLLEASLSEKPIITSNWSGHTDFLNSDLSILLPGDLVDVPKKSFPKDFYLEGMQWFTVNYQKASQSMQEVFKNYKKFKIPAKKQAMGNRAKFSLDAMTRELGKILDKYVPEFPKEVALKLPKLKKVGDTQPQKISLPKLKKV